MCQYPTSAAAHRQRSSGLLLSLSLPLFILIVLGSGCAHSRPAAQSLAAMPPPEASVIGPDQTVGTIIADPAPFIGSTITVSGLVADAKVTTVARDLSLLAVRLRDVDSAPVDVKVERPPSRYRFAAHLDRGAEHLKRAAGNVDLTTLAVGPIENLSTDMQIAASRLLALSHYYRSESLEKEGLAVADVATGYRQAAIAYKAIADLWAADVAETEAASPGPPVAGESQYTFHDYLVMAGAELLNAADLLLAQRQEMGTAAVCFAYEDLDDDIAHVLLSVANFLEADAWSEEREHHPVRAEQLRQMSQAFVHLGDGLGQITGGFHKLGAHLAEAYPIVTPATQPASGAVLRCAYVGYNDHVLQDCRSKMAQAGAGQPIVVRGRLLRGNLREELDVLWLKLESVTIDNLTVALNYDDESKAMRRAYNFYAWTGSLSD